MLLSRVADALYWMSRYLERAEHTARLIDVRLDLGLDRRPTPTAGTSTRLYAALRLATSRPGAAQSRRRWSTRSCSTRAIAASVLACVTAARENARQVREEISSDMWEQLNALFLRLKQARSDGVLVGAAALPARGWSSKACTSSRASPTRRWDTAKAGSTCRSGRFIERASGDRRAASICTSGRADAELPAEAIVEWVGLLRSCSALEAYCRYYTADLRPERIAEFLLLNAEFPRSVRFAAARVETSLRAIAQLTGRRRRRPRRAARRPAARLARLRPGRRDPERRSARATSRASAATARRSTRALYQSYIAYPDRVGAAGLTGLAITVHYTIRHVTRFTYETPISESVMEVRMQPRSDGDAALPALRPEHHARRRA